MITIAEKLRTVSREMFTPKTELGRLVKSGEISSIDQIYASGKIILEHEIVDILIPNLESETLKVGMTQRVTDSGKRNQFRVVVVVGDRNGHVGIGVGKSDEMRPAMEYAVRRAKKNLIPVKKGCGSWECKCGTSHSLPQRIEGKQGSSIVVLKPAPRGLGLAANDIVKKVLGMAGVKDVWSSSQGGSNVYNIAIATINALMNLNSLKPRAE